MHFHVVGMKQHQSDGVVAETQMSGKIPRGGAAHEFDLRILLADRIEHHLMFKMAAGKNDPGRGVGIPQLLPALGERGLDDAMGFNPLGLSGEPSGEYAVKRMLFSPQY